MDRVTEPSSPRATDALPDVTQHRERGTWSDSHVKREPARMGGTTGRGGWVAGAPGEIVAVELRLFPRRAPGGCDLRAEPRSFCSSVESCSRWAELRHEA
jgi:hypothetical protein